MHGTRDDGTTLFNGGAGYDHLLVGGSINATCLYCHDGKSYPDVVGSGVTTDMIPALGGGGVAGGQNSNYTTDPYGASAGGFLADYGTARSKFGHDLYSTASLVAIQGTWPSAATGMTCGDCHEVHGNKNYRNLKLRPGGTYGHGADINITENVAGADVQLDSTKTGTNQKRTDAVAFNAGNDVSNWCLDCHKDVDSSIVTKHPVDRSLAEATPTTDVDSANWLKGTSGGGWGFGATIDDAYGATEYGIPRVRFAQSGDSFSACTTVDDDNEVTCLTCHKAHGSKYDSLLCWPYSRYSSAPTPYSPIDRSAGCQQCHNRGIHD
jgi:hypothetical protein